MLLGYILNWLILPKKNIKLYHFLVTLNVAGIKRYFFPMTLDTHWHWKAPCIFQPHQTCLQRKTFVSDGIRWIGIEKHLLNVVGVK